LILQSLYKSWLHLSFPGKCLHCQSALPPDTPVLCSECNSLLDLIDPDKHCPTCFSPTIYYPMPCEECIHIPSLYTRVAAAFDYQGPAATLVKRLKYSNQPYLSKGMAAYLMLQFDRLQWPHPDAIVPIPISFTHWLSRGYNQTTLLANELSQYLRCPVWHAVKRKSGDFSQAALKMEQRKALDGKRFKRNKKYSLSGKILLVIDDVMTTGLTLHRCAESLSEANPAAIYALSFCKTQKD